MDTLGAHIHYRQSHFMVRATLANALKFRPSELFIKIHRSFVVSVLYINSIHKDHVEVLGAPVPVARQYYEGLMKRVSVIR